MLCRICILFLLAFTLAAQVEHRLVEGVDARTATSQGGKLVEALGDQQWIIAIDASAKVGRPLPVDKKLSDDLRDGQPPLWAQVKLRGDEGLELLVYFHYDVNADLAQGELDRLGAVLVDRSDYFHRLTVKLRRDDLRTLAALDWVRFVEPVFPPYQLESNLESGLQLGVNRLRTEFGLNGAGARVAIIDDPVDAHPEFGDRLRQLRSGPGLLHGTHVAGTVAAAGNADERLRGMAPEARLVSIPFASVAEGIAANLNAKLLEQADLGQNSWGGVIRNNLNNCNLHGAYGSADRELDRIVFQEKLPIVFSAGNDRSSPECLVAERAGYYSLTPPKSSKNIIVVGAVDQSQDLSAFSSVGPTRDGRLKPDVVALGVSVLSTGIRGGTGTLSGTSMAAPAISGLTALLIDRYRERHNAAPEPALLRAVLLNTAKDLGNPGPDYQFGFGIPDAVEAVRTFDEDRWRRAEIHSGQTIEFDVDIPGGAPALRAMLAWTDPPAPAGRQQQLMNDLDLRLVSPTGDTVLPFRLDPRRPERDAERAENTLDNVEQVAVDAPLGGRWKIVISSKELVVGPQDFVISWTTAENPRPRCTTTVNPTSLSAAERAGSLTIQIARSSTCEPWEVAGAPAWLRPVLPPSTSASGVVKLALDRNDSGEQRTASLTIAGRNVSLRQNTVCQAREVKPGEPITATLSASDCLQEGLTQSFFTKIYEFTATAGQRAVIRVNSSTTDPYIFLYGPGGIYLAEDDDSGGGLNSRIPASGSLVLPLDGKYRILVSTAFAGQTGSFTLNLELSPAEGEPTALPKLITACPVELDGELTDQSSRDGRRGDLYRTDVYLFQGRVGQTVNLGLLAADFDGVAYLISPTGATLAFNDDSDGNRPFIEQPLSANGVYRLEISSFAPFATGRYKLAAAGCSEWDGR